MNILFVMYGDFSTNSAHPMALHARGLRSQGHQCVAAVPTNVESIRELPDPAFRAVLYRDALADPSALFPDGRPADVLHAWTPREGVRRFVTSYLARRPTPWIAYLEDNEEWIARAALGLVGLREEVLLQHSGKVISDWVPDGLPHPLRHERFVGLADAAVVIQDKLASEVPPWVACTTIMPGVDLDAFAPRDAQPALRSRYGVAEGERVIVYPGGLNDFTRPGLHALCAAVAEINARGVPCKLLRSGPVPLDFLAQLSHEAASAIVDLGPLPRGDLPALFALADVFVQPGSPDPFEDLRLPGKLPEFFAAGRPVVLPDTNITYLLRDGVDAVFHRTGSAGEIAEKCLALFADPARARRIGEAGRRFAETHFDPNAQAARLADAYAGARSAFDAGIAAQVWDEHAASASVTALLARKLRLLAASRDARDVFGARMLAAHASGLEFLEERSEGLEAGMEVRDAQIAGLAKEVESAAALAAALRQEIAQARTQLERARESLASSEHALGEMRASMSWRLMRPLRALAGIAARLFSWKA